MRIYKVHTAQMQKQQTPVDPKVRADIDSAIANLQYSVAKINESLKTIETLHMETLYSRKGILDAIQSGDLTHFDVNAVDQAMQAMQAIAQTMPIINKSITYLHQNTAQVAQAYPDFADINNIGAMMVNAITNGDYSQFTASMPGFQSNMQNLSGTTEEIG